MMRRWVLVALVMAAMSACTRPPAPSGTLTIAQQWEPRSLNPALENGTSSTEWSMLVFSYLVKYDDDGNLIPDIATEVPTLQNGGISADGKTIVYHIRKGIRFADGSPLTAADCAWSIEAINNPKNNVQSRFAYDDVISADAPNSTTLVLHLTKMFPPIIVVVGAPQGFPIFPKHALASLPDINSAPFNRAPFGSGPYLVSNWVPGDRVELRANPYYWKEKPGIPQITVRFIGNAQTALNMLRTKEVDAYFDSQDYGIYPELLRVPGYVVTSTEQNAVGAIIFNTQDPVTSDPRVRHALAEAINIPYTVAKAYRKSLDSVRAGAGLFLWAFDPSAYPDVPYDPSDARRLLDAAGWHMGADGIRHKNGVPLHVLLILQAQTPADAVASLDIAQYERAVGANVTLKEFQVTQFVAPSDQGGPVYGGKFQMALYSFENGDDPDTTDQFACANVPPNGYNKSRICDPRIDDLLRQGLSTYDAASRKKTYSALQKLLFEQLPIALIYRRTQVNAFSDQIVGQTTAPAGGAFWNVAQWSFCGPRVYAPVGTYARTRAPLQGPGLILEGGGTDIDAEWHWAHDTISGGSHARFGNVVVLRAHGTNDYDPYIAPLGPFQSVRTIIIPPCATRAQVDAMAPYVDGADVLFFSGGDQANYAPWKGSALIDAVRRIRARGGVEGGTSAGLAIQGAYGYDSVAADRLHPNDDSFEVRTPDATRDPLEPEISFTANMFAWPPLRSVITDTHFARRDRFGRLIAFLANIEQSQHLRTGTVYGLAVDERSALLVDRSGIATLAEYRGSGYRTRGAYLIHLVNVEPLRPGRPLVATVEVLHLGRPGAKLDLPAKRGDGTIYRLTVDGGKTPPYSRDPY
jgi:peptide/nickel transport system substrate-binding protein